jgi:hypothetical protein
VEKVSILKFIPEIGGHFNYLVPLLQQYPLRSHESKEIILQHWISISKSWVAQ